MDQATSHAPQKRLVYPPLPETSGSDNSVLYVLLGEDEEVQWHWTFREGQSIVTGYEIVKQPSVVPHSV